MSRLTKVCPRCNGTGWLSRWVYTTQQTGTVMLRYTPKEPRGCWCIQTAGGNTATQHYRLQNDWRDEEASDE